jgi:pheromone shutdown protein TraB
VAPSIFRPVLTASRPSQTIPTTGPESTGGQLDPSGERWRKLTVGDESLEETLAGKVGVVLLEVLLQQSALVLSSDQGSRPGKETSAGGQ